MFEPIDFYTFLKAPRIFSFERKDTFIFGTAIKLYLTILLFVGSFSVLTETILQAFLPLPVDEALEVPDFLKERIFYYVVLVAFVAPTLEEVIFRLSLIFNPLYLSLSFSTLIALIVNKHSDKIIAAISFIVLFFLVYRLVFSYKTKLSSFWNKYFTYIFYFLCIIFGAIHISNYKFINNVQYFIVPILILPQLALGLVLSFTRVYYKKGFLISILVHCVANLVSVTIYLLQNSTK